MAFQTAKITMDATTQEHQTGGSGSTGVGRKGISRRSHLEIRMDVLRAVMEGAEGPTQIMYKANLSWILLCEHLSALTEHGFIEEKIVGSRKKYTLTGKGVDMVRSYLNMVREIVLEVPGTLM